MTLAKSVVTSSLTKAAIYGHDANWGRIICALGYAGVDFDPRKVDLYFESSNGRLKIIENGVATGYSEEEATKMLDVRCCDSHLRYETGGCRGNCLGMRLTYDYVKIDADYRS